MRYIPSPTTLQFSYVYSATANSSGRMQYHRIKPGQSKQRISRTEFIKAYNDSQSWLLILCSYEVRIPFFNLSFMSDFNRYQLSVISYQSV